MLQSMRFELANTA